MVPLFHHSVTKRLNVRRQSRVVRVSHILSTYGTPWYGTTDICLQNMANVVLVRSALVDAILSFPSRRALAYQSRFAKTGSQSSWMRMA